MINLDFSQRSGFLFLIIFSLIAPAQFAFATTPTVPCSRYGFLEVYSLDQNNLPVGISLRQDGVTKNYFLKNSSPQPLVIDFGSKSQHQIRLQNGEAYIEAVDSDVKYYEEKPIRGSLYDLARLNKEIPNPASFSSNTKPTPMAPVRFSIIAQYNKKPITITGTLSYVLVENDCATEKAVAPQTRSFWAVVLDFFASFKFW